MLAQSPLPPKADEIYTVSRLNREARELLERGFPLIWIEGEISNLVRPASGHLYLTLKDDRAQVRCALFRTRRRQLAIEPENGMQVRARVRIGLYETRGEFQLVAEHLEEAGDGLLRCRFEALKQRLAQAGLFDAVRKRRLPPIPRRIGLITSPSGAAVRDVLSVLRRRFSSMEVLIYPAAVQGAGAAADLTATLQLAAARRECDVLLLVRGGGSFEDLDAFNDEALARTIAACPIPLVTGIGHEIDFTIADFAADHRAPTPSAAAELLSPDHAELARRVAARRDRLVAAMSATLRHLRDRTQWLDKRLGLQHPGQRLQHRMQRLDELELRLRAAQAVALRRWQARADTLAGRLRRASPAQRVATLRARIAGDRPRLLNAMQARLDRHQRQLEGLGRALDAVSPLATLGRGYSIMTRAQDAQLVRQIADVEVGCPVQARLRDGRLRCSVEGIEPADKSSLASVRGPPPGTGAKDRRGGGTP